jgi:hypothetical protein
MFGFGFVILNEKISKIFKLSPYAFILNNSHPMLCDVRVAKQA